MRCRRNGPQRRTNCQGADHDSSGPKRTRRPLRSFGPTGGDRPSVLLAPLSAAPIASPDVLRGSGLNRSPPARGLLKSARLPTRGKHALGLYGKTPQPLARNGCGFRSPLPQRETAYRSPFHRSGTPFVADEPFQIGCAPFIEGRREPLPPFAVVQSTGCQLKGVTFRDALLWAVCIAVAGDGGRWTCPVRSTGQFPPA